ncbi:MarR family transcriptional regulator [Actinomadura sp. LD22]|uniref:MarR family transcriptional regulator n=1 Tax=Actinomadura physcomitrii TaxID=2650748 RepID=A0A6I4LZZ5_9ACTN|nr:MarR family transcriptional regulator [Actinomadura physcomitrii]MVZ99197.1 MarR family transcriptional regulator [Actinomadura physcomitrii]
MTTDAAADRPLDTVDALVQLSFLVQRALSALGAEHELSIIQMRLLGILRDRDAGMVELATYLGLDKSSMTGLVGRAEKRGLVRRARSPHDGRAVLVSLTPDGRRLTERAGAEIGRRVTALTERLSPAERAELTRLAAVLLDGTVSQAPWARRR